MTKNVKSEIKNTGFADIPCDETIHRDDNHIFHLCKWNIKDQFIGYSDVIFLHKDTHRLLHPDYINPLNPYNITFLSAILSKITDITNKYLSDKRIYIPGITPKSYYYLSRGYGKSIRELRYFMKLISDSEKSQFSYNPYTPEYTVQNYKSDVKNLYKAMISQKILNSYITQNNSTKQRSNNKEEMSCLKIIADRNNTNKKFYK